VAKLATFGRLVRRRAISFVSTIEAGSGARGDHDSRDEASAQNSQNEADMASALTFALPSRGTRGLPHAFDPEPDRLRATAPTPFFRRLARAVKRETAIEPRLVAAHLISRGFRQFAFNRTRTLLLRAAGISIGEGTSIMGTLRITGHGSSSLLSFGKHTQISGPLLVDLGARVSIGDRVHFGQEVMLLTMEHEIGPAEERCGRLTAAPICIEDGVWLASRVTILPGVTVGRGSVVAAGAVVTTDVPPNSLVGGVPARLVRSLDEDAPPSLRRRRSRPANDGD
jgi:maltose O-acetyltransferase